jgi:hypothetical protein
MLLDGASFAGAANASNVIPDERVEPPKSHVTQRGPAPVRGLLWMLAKCERDLLALRFNGSRFVRLRAC